MGNDTKSVEKPVDHLPEDVERLPHRFFEQSTPTVAKMLLGKVLLRRESDGWSGGLIVETEAYLHRHDPACHAARGMTRRNRSMFLSAGHLYVYTIHAKWCANVVTGREGIGSAVLIRAIEPCWGEAWMRSRRKTDSPVNWTRGPARLCQALQIDGALDGCRLTDRHAEVQVLRWKHRIPPWEMVSTTRIGIRQGADLPLRFFVRGNRFVSGPRSVHDVAGNCVQGEKVRERLDAVTSDQKAPTGRRASSRERR
jgi:DNA-3-methyladenine glycosylase